MQFTKEQENILLQITGSFRVLAAAGSGKTTTLSCLVRSEILSERTAESDICFITFTRFAADQIKTKLIKIMGYMPQILYGTFHATMSRLLNKSGIKAPEPKGLYDIRLEQAVIHFLECMEKREVKLVNILSKFKVLIIDEFQDLDRHQFDFVRFWKEIQPNLRIMAIGDLAQNIYRFRGTSNEFLRTLLKNEIAPDLKTFNLTTNFRSSKSILNFVNIIFKPEIQDEHIMPMEAPEATALGEIPHYYEYAKNPGSGFGEYEDLVVTTLMPILKDAKAASKSVVLIFPIIKCASYQIITALLRDNSKRHGFSFDIHQIAKEDETCSTISFDYDPKSPNSPIQCSTFHSSKGLEWDIVALINFSDKIYDVYGEDSEAHYAEKTNLAYVGITRAAEMLYIFADANAGGRCRLFSRLGADLTNVVKLVQWGEEAKSYEKGPLRPIGVTDLLRKLPQHPDLYERARKCSEKIPVLKQKNGCPLALHEFYGEMRKRNREMAFGTYVDWKLKRELCPGKSKTLQELIIELKTACQSIIGRSSAFEDIETRMCKLDVFFLNSNNEPTEELVNYIIASRYLALFSGRIGGMVPSVKSIWYSIEKRIITIVEKTTKTITEEYIQSQIINFYVRGVVSEIQAVDAPENSYQGLPAGFENFVKEAIRPAIGVVKSCMDIMGALTNQIIRADVPLETKSLIMGEADMIAGDLLIEIKCGSEIDAIKLRDSGNCKNLLQILTYVSMGRHGTIPLSCKHAAIVNPLTGAWEIYNIDEWSHQDSSEFMEIIEELRLQI